MRHSCRKLLGDTLVGLPRYSAYYSCTTRSPILSFQLLRYSAYYSCTTRSPVLSFQLHRLLRVLKLYYKVASSQLTAPQIAPRTTVVLQSRQFSASSSTDTSLATHTQIPMARPHPTPQTHDSPNPNPNGAVYRHSHPRDSLRLARIFPHPHVERAQSPAPATKCHLPRHTLTCKSQWHGHIQHPKHTTHPTVIPMVLCTMTHNLTIPCANRAAPATTCDLRHTSQPHDSLRLPRQSHFHASKPARSPAPATKSDNIIACELQQNLHHATRLE